MIVKVTKIFIFIYARKDHTAKVGDLFEIEATEPSSLFWFNIRPVLKSQTLTEKQEFGLIVKDFLLYHTTINIF